MLGHFFWRFKLRTQFGRSCLLFLAFLATCHLDYWEAFLSCWKRSEVSKCYLKIRYQHRKCFKEKISKQLEADRRTSSQLENMWIINAKNLVSVGHFWQWKWRSKRINCWVHFKVWRISDENDDLRPSFSVWIQSNWQKSAI